MQPVRERISCVPTWSNTGYFECAEYKSMLLVVLGGYGPLDEAPRRDLNIFNRASPNMPLHQGKIRPQDGPRTTSDAYTQDPGATGEARGGDRLGGTRRF